MIQITLRQNKIEMVEIKVRDYDLYYSERYYNSYDSVSHCDYDLNHKY